MEDDKIVQLYLNRDESAIKFSSEKYGPAYEHYPWALLQIFTHLRSVRMIHTCRHGISFLPMNREHSYMLFLPVLLGTFL